MTVIPATIVPIVMAAMRDSAKLTKVVEMQATLMKATTAMAMATVSVQTISSEVMTRIATTVNSNSLVVVVTAGKEGSLE